MTSSKPPQRLGKGIGSLLSNRHATDTAASDGKHWVPHEDLRPSGEQPRLHLDRGIKELAESLRRHGMMQPIVVTQDANGNYEILAGERRWRAAKVAGLVKVPVVIREGSLTGEERLELALIENIQREDLDPIERATACQRLMGEYSLTQQQVADRLGYKRPTVANLVRLLDLPEPLRLNVSRGTLSAGHARALLSLDGEAEMLRAAKEIVDSEFSVRAAESMCKAMAAGKTPPPAHKARPAKPAWAAELQEKLSRKLGCRAEMKLHTKGGGKVVLHFADLDSLDRVVVSLGLNEEADELLGS
ncbi:MAG: ParB/RepB/Spo0J family partition protein [Planctomycetota bacterium]|jgi:ParB family chromosome partitioning protein|nr:ParB/RepB/Spo0J family partition protein [Planctomycetota bacterium]